MPQISVVIPTFNRAELLRKAIRSVLDQAGDNFEVVISDNCSQDATAGVVAEFASDPRVIYSRNEYNIGLVANWRKGIFDIARGEWFVLMSDDDYFTDPEYLQKATRAIESHQPAFVYSGGVVHDVLNETFEPVRLPFNGLIEGGRVFASRGTLRPQDVLLPTMLFRREDAKRLGFLIDPDNLSSDSELYLKLCAEGDVFAIASPACVYLKHGSNVTNKLKTSRRLLDHNLDHLVNPYAHAREKGMSQQFLDEFRRNAGLDDGIGSAFLRLRLHDRRWYRECRDRIAQRVPDVVLDVESSLRYRVKFALLSVVGVLLRGRYPLDDAAAGSH